MPSCHDPAPTAPGRRGALATRVGRIALVGNPNVGKSTLFNALTGARQQTVNAPGTTVQMGSGRWSLPASAVELIDLPGTYSLLARSPDEQVTTDLIAGVAGSNGAEASGSPDLVVLVADGTALGRSLYLLAQIAERRIPVVLAVSMVDVAADRGIEIDLAALAESIGVPAVAVNPRGGKGLDDLASAVERALAEPAVPIDPAAGAGGSAAAGSDASGADASGSDAETERAELRFVWVETVLAAAVTAAPDRPSRSDRIDRLVLNPWVGVPVFLATMWGVFTLTTTVAAPLQGYFESLVSGPLSELAKAGLRAVGLAGTPVTGFVVDGLLAGVGTVLTFVPLMAIMFALLTILDDSGYLARVALLGDRLMRVIGLDGRAILPLIVGFGCNVPAVSATRTLPNARQRMLAGLLVPLTSCSARLTVYVLLASIFFRDHAGTVVFAMYLTSGAVVLLAGVIMRRTAFRDLQREPLVLELPPYRVPTPKALLSSTWFRVRGFVQEVGTVIVGTLSVLWLLSSIPVVPGYSFGQVPVGDSAFGATSRAVSGVFEPAGFGEWQPVAALASGFIAKEVVVGSLAQSYAAEPDGTGEASLSAKLRASFDSSSGGHGGAAALAYLVFVLAYTPCLATLAVQRRMFGLRPTAAAVLAQLALAWTLAVVVFQIGRLM